MSELVPIVASPYSSGMSVKLSLIAFRCWRIFKGPATRKLVSRSSRISTAESRELCLNGD